VAVKVLISGSMGKSEIERIEAVDDLIMAVSAPKRENALAEAKDAEVILAGDWFDDLWKAAPKLKWVQSNGAGVEQFLTPDFVHSAIALTNAQGVYAIPIADQVMAYILHFSRGLNRLLRNQIERKWLKWEELLPDELQDKTLGIVGLGQIGSEVAKRAKSFGMHVIATRRRLELPSEYDDEVRKADELPWLLAESDYVALCLALTPETKCLITGEELRMMKSKGFLINVGRGGLVDEAALVAALRSGEIAGAGLDVFEEEPLPEDSPLWDMEDVIITPHNAGSSPRSWERFMALFCENLRRYCAGEPLLNVVDKVAGY